MIFPKWAPARLIEEYSRLQVEAVNRRKRAAEEDEDNSLDEDWPTDGITHKKEIVQPEELAYVLSRLLTYPDMKAVWTALLSRPSANPKPWKEPAYLLWNSVSKALRDFPILLANAQTPAETRKSLLSIAVKAKALQRAIAADPIAKRHAKDLVAVHLTNRNLEDRQDDGETPSVYEFQMPLTLSCDCHEAWRFKEVRDNYRTGYTWSQSPLLCRLTYWAREAKETGLNELLQLFINCVEGEAELSPEIKQPGRSADAIKPFLIRRISGYLLYYYGQPLDDIAAQIVSVVLDLETPLTRDDIRPYVFSTGKKMV